MNSAILVVESLSKNFGGVQALYDINLRVELGERRAIIGPNGAGKTTLFNLTNGELFPSSGRVFLYGKDVTRLPVYRRADLGVCRTFQVTSLFFNLSLIENVLLAAQAQSRARFGMFRPRTSYNYLYAKAERLIKDAGLWDRRDTQVQHLSYGEQRRIEIILAIATEGKLLLLDEPTAGLSPEETRDLVSFILGLGSDITTVFIEHDIDVALQLADRITVLHYGRILAEGSKEEIKMNPKVKEVYLGL